MNSEALISVVIPCRNEVNAIEGTVRAILASYHTNLEVLVVDGMSADGTRDVLTRLSECDARVRMINNPKQLTPFAFNIGVRAARGEYVQIVGSRNALSPGYLSILREQLDDNPNVACVGGDYQHIYDSEPGRYIAAAMESKFGVGSGNYRTMGEDAYVDTVGVPMYRQSIFSELGYFDEALTRNQDDDFNFRVRKAGHKIKYVHKAKVSYLVRGSLSKAFRQYQQYGYFKVFVNRKHGAVTTLRQVVPAAFVAFWAIGFPLSFLWGGLRPVLSLAALIYLLFGMVFSGAGLSLIDRVHVVAASFVLHVGYGYGYWQGIWDFLIMRESSPRGELQRQTT